MTREKALQIAKPILFNTEMVRAIQDNLKTVTRRIIKVPETAHLFLGINPETVKAEFLCGEVRNGISADWEIGIKLPYQVGDILYVREAFWHGVDDVYEYKADYETDMGYIWSPSIHMPKEAARIFLRVTGVRVERLQNSFFGSERAIFALMREGVNIGEQCQDCILAYGTPCCVDDESECRALDEVRSDFADLWDSTVKKSDIDKYGWDANPWVSVTEFERVEVSE